MLRATSEVNVWLALAVVAFTATAGFLPPGRVGAAAAAATVGTGLPLRVGNSTLSPLSQQQEPQKTQQQDDHQQQQQQKQQLPAPAASNTTGGSASGLPKDPSPAAATSSVPPSVPKTSHIVAPDVLPGSIDSHIEAQDAFSSVVYVVVGLTIVILIYMVIKNFRLRYESVRAERYGVRRRWRDQELQPLGRDNDDDEETLFEARRGAAL